MELGEIKTPISQLRLQEANSSDEERTVWIAKEDYLIVTNGSSRPANHMFNYFGVWARLANAPFLNNGQKT